MRAFFLVFLFIPLSSFATEFSVLSWNLFMLPKPIKFSQQAARTRAIPELLSKVDTDLIVLQEAFTASVRGGILRRLSQKYPHHFYLKKDNRPSRAFGSGVLLLSRYPIRLLDRVYFNWCASADCFAAKGSFLVEVDLPGGKTIQIAGTHLQAIEGKGHIRLHQLGQIRQLMTRHQREGVPQILAGDLNIDVSEPEFGTGLELMDMENLDLQGPIRGTSRDFKDCAAKSGGNEWIDHVWFRGESLRGTLEVVTMNYQRGKKVCPASDHHAILGKFVFDH